MWGLLCAFRFVRFQILALYGHVVNGVSNLTVFLACGWLLVFKRKCIHEAIKIIAPPFPTLNYADLTALWLAVESLKSGETDQETNLFVCIIQKPNIANMANKKITNSKNSDHQKQYQAEKH